MTAECFDDLFRNFNFANTQCIKLLISKMLGYVIIAGSVLVKVGAARCVRVRACEGCSRPE